MSTPLHRRRGRDPLLSKLQSNYNDNDNDFSIASMTKNNKDHVRLSSGLRTTVELPVQPKVMLRQEAAPWTRGQEAEAEAEAEVTRGDTTTSGCKQSEGAGMDA
jgi:hypothetical protein